MFICCQLVLLIKVNMFFTRCFGSSVCFDVFAMISSLFAIFLCILLLIQVALGI